MPWLGAVVTFGFLLAFSLILALLAAATVRLLRARRRGYLLVVAALFAWALASWTDIAAGVAPLREALGGQRTLLALNLLAQLIFGSLALVVFHAAWGWFHINLPRFPRRPRARTVDRESWLR